MLLILVSFSSLGLFNILQDGSVILRSTLDYEDTRTYNLVISAVDSGFPSMSGTANLAINLIDVNDNIPVFSGSQLIFSTTEVGSASYM